MHNPFRILKLLLHIRRPSRIDDMPVVTDAFWLRKGYDALTFFGTIVTATNELALRMDRKKDFLKNHEMIHLRQAQSTHDSWLCFYSLYLWYYVRALPMNRHLRNAAYELNPFEMEAYKHMYDTNYLNQPQCGSEWRKYAQMKPCERLRLQRQQNGTN